MEEGNGSRLDFRSHPLGDLRDGEALPIQVVTVLYRFKSECYRYFVKDSANLDDWPHWDNSLSSDMETPLVSFAEPGVFSVQNKIISPTGSAVPVVFRHFPVH